MGIIKEKLNQYQSEPTQIEDTNLQDEYSKLFEQPEVELPESFVPDFSKPQPIKTPYGGYNYPVNPEIANSVPTQEEAKKYTGQAEGIEQRLKEFSPELPKVETKIQPKPIGKSFQEAEENRAFDQNVDDLIKQADGRIKELSKLDADYIKSQPAPEISSLSNYGLDKPLETPYEKQIQSANKAKELLEMLRKYKGNREGLIQGIKQSDWKDVFSLGLKGLTESGNLITVAKKAESGQPLNEDEQILLTAYGIYNAYQSENTSDFGYGTGKLLTGMIPFMAQMAMTGGTGTLLIKGGKEGAKFVLKEYLKTLPKNLVKQAAYDALRVPLMPMAYKTLTEKLTPDIVLNQQGQGTVVEGTGRSFINAAAQAFAGTFGERYFEGFGGIFDNIAGAGMKQIGKLGKNVLFDTASKSKFIESLNAIRKSVGLNNPLGELIEEDLNGLYAPLIDDEAKFSDTFNLQTQGQILLSSAIMGGMFKIAELPGHVQDYSNITKPYKDSIISLSQNFGEDAQKIIQANSFDSLSERMAANDQLNTLADTPEKRLAWLDYFNKKVQYDLLNESIKTDQEEKVTEQVSPMVNKQTGMIHPAVTTDERQVFITNTQEGIHSVFNPETGEIELLADKDISKENALDPINTEQFISQNTNQALQGSELDLVPVGTPVVIDGKAYNVDAVNGDIVSLFPEDINEAPIEVPVSQILTQVTQQLQPEEKETPLQSEEQTVAPEEKLPEQQPIIPEQQTDFKTETQQTEPTKQIPLDKDGNPDYDQMDPEMFAQEFSKEFGEEETKNELSSMKEALNTKIQALSAKNTKATSLNDKAKIKREMKQLNDRLTSIDQIINNITPKPVSEENRVSAVTDQGVTNTNQDAETIRSDQGNVSEKGITDQGIENQGGENIQLDQEAGAGTGDKSQEVGSLVVSRGEKQAPEKAPVSLKNKQPIGVSKDILPLLQLEPQSFEQGLLQYLLSGGRVDRQQFIRYSGLKGKDLNPFFSMLKNNGQQIDTINEVVETFKKFDNDSGMDMINEVVDIMTSNPGKKSMGERLQKLFGQNVNLQEFNSISDAEESAMEVYEKTDEIPDIAFSMPVNDDFFDALASGDYEINDDELGNFDNYLISLTNEQSISDTGRSEEKAPVVQEQPDTGATGVQQEISPAEVQPEIAGLPEQQITLSESQQAELDKQLSEVDSKIQEKDSQLNSLRQKRERELARLDSRNGLFGDTQERPNTLFAGEFLFNKETVGNALKDIDGDISNAEKELDSLNKLRIGIVENAGKQQELKLEQVKNDIAVEELKVNTEPTEAQKEAGNYAKGHINIQGLDITIENPKGSTRKGVDDKGNPWESVLNNTYGYFKGTEGKDKDHVDVFLGDNPLSEKVYVVDQIKPETGVFDEHKIMMGFKTEEEARNSYLSNYQPGWAGLGAITEMPINEFKEWVFSGKVEKPLSYKQDNVMFSLINQTDLPEFKNWFKKSKVVDNNGRPLVVYHGTGTTITEFKPEFTGQGMDQLGSGFYFTTDKDEADVYKTAINSLGTEKPGGTDNPNVIEAFLSIQNPIKVKGNNLNDVDIDITLKQAISIIKKSPILYDKDNSPLGNWFDIWTEGIRPNMINEVAKEYTGSSLISLEGDFFKGHESKFREAIRDILGYDGVELEFENKKHYVAWFPNQIKSATLNNGKFDISNPDIRFSLSSESTPVNKQSIQQYFDELNSGAPIKVVDNNKEIIDDYKANGGNSQYIISQLEQMGNFTGLYSSYLGKIYIKSNVSNPDSFWIHENTHFGVDLILFDRALKVNFFNKIYQSLGENKIRFGIPLDYLKLSESVRAEEYLTYKAQAYLESGKIDIDNFYTQDEVLNLMEEKTITDEQIDKLINTFVRASFNVKQNDTSRSNDNRPEDKGIRESTRTTFERRIRPVLRASEKGNVSERGVYSGNKFAELEKLKQDIRKAESETNTNPSEEEIQSNAYRKGKVNIQGLNVAIENPVGSYRNDVKITNTYGEIEGTIGKEGDPLDIFLGDNPLSDKVYIVNQIKSKSKKFDQHKIMVGFDNEEDARSAYEQNKQDLIGGREAGSILEVSMDEFKKWAYNGQKIYPFIGVEKNVFAGDVIDQKSRESNLKRWAGNTKIVDENGNPAVYYHGTPADFDTFQPNKKGLIFASPSYSFAQGGFTGILPEGYSGSVMPVYIKAENPFDYRNPEHVQLLLDKLGEVKGSLRDNIILGSPWGLEKGKVPDTIKELGFDSFYITEEGTTNIAVYEPTQLKSATGNQGTFSSKNPDIRFGIEPPQPPKKPKTISDYLPEDKTPFKPVIETNFEKFQEAIQDRMLSVKKLQKELKVTNSTDVYKTENLSSSRANNAIENFNDNLFEPIIKTIGEIEKKHNISSAKTQEYMKAKHAIERNAWFRTQTGAEKVFAGISDEEAQKIIDGFESKVSSNEVNKLWEQINKATEFTLNKYVEYGFMTRQNKDDIKSRGWKYYVPLRGWELSEEEQKLDEEYNLPVGFGSLNPLKTTKGRESLSDDPLPYIASMAHSIVAMGEKNRVKQAAIKLVMSNKEKTNLFNMKKVYQVQSGVDEEGKPTYIETYEKPQATDDAKQLLNKDHQYKKERAKWKQHEVEAYINGEKYVAVFADPNVAHAINYENQYAPEITRAFQQSIGRATRWLSQNFTAKNPAFIPVNAMRDIAYATIATNLKHGINPVKFVGYIKEAKGAISRDYKKKTKLTDREKQLDKWYQEFKEWGGQTGYVHLTDISELKREVERQIRILNGTGKWYQKGYDFVNQAKLIQSAGKLLDRFAVISENMSRFATYAAIREQGKSPMDAAFAAKEVTVNFNKKGTMTGILGSTFAFFNASVQGGFNALNLAKEHKGKFIAVAASFYAMGVLNALLASLWDDDDKYKNINDFIKQTNLIIPKGIGEDSYISIPLPQFFRQFFAAGVLTMQMFGKEKEIPQAVGEMVSNAFESVSPVNPVGFINKKGETGILDITRPFIPTIGVPVLDLIMNEDFAGRRIVRTPFTEELKDRIAFSQQYGKGINPILTGISNAIFKAQGGDKNIKRKSYYEYDEDQKKVVLKRINPVIDALNNPAVSEHIIEYYTGGRGKFFSDLVKLSTDVVVGSYYAIKEKDFQKLSDEFNANSVPIFNRLNRTFYNDPSYELERQFYETGEKIKDYKDLKEQYKKLETKEGYEKFGELSSDSQYQKLQGLFEERKKIVSELNSQIKDATERGETKTVDELKSYRDELIKDYLKTIGQ